MAINQGQYPKAFEYISESLHCNQQSRHLQGINRCAAAFACLLAARGQLTQAAQLGGAVESFLISTSGSLFHWDAEAFNRSLVKLRAELPETVFKKAWKKGAGMTLDEAIEFALREA